MPPTRFGPSRGSRYPYERRVPADLESQPSLLPAQDENTVLLTDWSGWLSTNTENNAEFLNLYHRITDTAYPSVSNGLQYLGTGFDQPAEALLSEITSPTGSREHMSTSLRVDTSRTLWPSPHMPVSPHLAQTAPSPTTSSLMVLPSDSPALTPSSAVTYTPASTLLTPAYSILGLPPTAGESTSGNSPRKKGCALEENETINKRATLTCPLVDCGMTFPNTERAVVKHVYVSCSSAKFAETRFEIDCNGERKPCVGLPDARAPCSIPCPVSTKVHRRYKNPYRSLRTWAIHLIMIHGRRPKPSICTSCPEIFGSANELVDHQTRVLCPVCNKQVPQCILAKHKVDCCSKRGVRSYGSEMNESILWSNLTTDDF